MYVETSLCIPSLEDINLHHENDDHYQSFHLVVKNPKYKLVLEHFKNLAAHSPHSPRHYSQSLKYVSARQ